MGLPCGKGKDGSCPTEKEGRKLLFFFTLLKEKIIVIKKKNLDRQVFAQMSSLPTAETTDILGLPCALGKEEPRKKNQSPMIYHLKAA